MKRLRIEVPATSANLGPGFDTLGLALNITEVIWVELDPESAEVVLEGSSVAGRHDNLLSRAYCRWASDTGETLPGARFRVEGHIPVGKGLGSSAGCIIAGLAAAAHAAGDKEATQRILRLATQMEGHADNVAAALLGGLTCGIQDGDDVRAIHVLNHANLGIALFIPDDHLLTVEARAALPGSIPMQDAIFEIGRLAFLVTALIWGRWEDLGVGMQDKLHQPYRTKLIPGLDAVMAAALESGAYGSALSGGGPSVIALCPPHGAEQVAAAMLDRARDAGWCGQSRVTEIRAAGVQVKEEPV